jgi:REP element-mobilizing transposase RayT
VNSFESASSEMETGQRETRETSTVSRIAISAPVPEIKHEEERPPVNQGAGEAIDAEPFSPYPCNLSYSCMLIPRFSDHYLTGDITEFLTEWLRQVCVSYGWRLDAIVVRPGYVQWVMTVPPTANPAQFMRLTRRHTSQKIFEEFPRFKQKNMSGDFWAPGYFVAAGDQLQQAESINNFILVTRRQQGIY